MSKLLSKVAGLNEVDEAKFQRRYLELIAGKDDSSKAAMEMREVMETLGISMEQAHLDINAIRQAKEYLGTIAAAENLHQRNQQIAAAFDSLLQEKEAWLTEWRKKHHQVHIDQAELAQIGESAKGASERLRKLKSEFAPVLSMLDIPNLDAILEGIGAAIADARTARDRMDNIGKDVDSITR